EDGRRDRRESERRGSSGGQRRGDEPREDRKREQRRGTSERGQDSQVGGAATDDAGEHELLPTGVLFAAERPDGREQTPDPRDHRGETAEAPGSEAADGEQL